MRLIQITDSHLHADKRARSRAGIPWQQFQRVLEAVAAERPDVVVFTGDVSQDETAASYAHAREALSALPCPWFWIPGNHDQLELMSAEQPLLDEVDLDQWRLLLLDTQVVGKPHGELGSDTLSALAERLDLAGIVKGQKRGVNIRLPFDCSFLVICLISLPNNKSGTLICP